jgi:TolB-like protein/cytochrome c-type biogenesis protein CcmH/NrfG
VRFQFGEYSLDTDLREMRRGGTLVPMEPQVFDLLVHMIVNRNKVVSKDELLASVWGGRVVSDATIDSRINALRRALGDSSLVRTFPRKGIRFAGEVREARSNTAPRPSVGDRPSIAVLPFVNMSGDPEQEFFADGMVEDLITSLSRLHWLFVIARNSTFTYKGQAVDVRRVAEDLGVRYVVEGSVRRVGERVRVTAQLIDGETGRHVWGDRYDHAMVDIFALQDRITDTICAVLEPEISHAERERARRRLPNHLGAWELYQRAMWFLLRRNRETLAEASGLLRDAIALDPDFAGAHAALAVSEFWMITHGITADAEANRAMMLQQGALAVSLDPRDPMAHSALGLAFMETGQHDRAIAEHEIAIALNPNSAFGQWCFGYALNRADRYAEALERFDIAVRLSPRDPAIWSYLTLRASALYQLNDYEAAAAAAREATRAQVVDLIWPFVHLAASLGRLGQLGEAREVLGALLRLQPELTVQGFRAWPHNRHRSRESCERVVAGLRAAGLRD